VCGFAAFTTVGPTLAAHMPQRQPSLKHDPLRGQRPTFWDEPFNRQTIDTWGTRVTSASATGCAAAAVPYPADGSRAYWLLY
jgi:hypothetical protein